jgi:hypothetical protein
MTDRRNALARVRKSRMLNEAYPSYTSNAPGLGLANPYITPSRSHVSKIRLTLRNTGNALTRRACPQRFVLVTHNQLGQFTAFHTNKLIESILGVFEGSREAGLLDPPQNLAPETRGFHGIDVADPRNSNDILRSRQCRAHALDSSKTISNRACHWHYSNQRRLILFGSYVHNNRLTELWEEHSQHFSVFNELENTINTVTVSEIQFVASRFTRP